MITEINDGYVRTDREHGIVTIEFFHPQSNSLPSKILEALAQTIHGEGLNSNTKVILLKSAGESVFCSGASFAELSSITTEAQGKAFFVGFAKVIIAMRNTPQFIIVRVQGKSVGGGVGLIAAADYAIAAEGADVRLSELSFGIGPFVVGPVIEKKIGLASYMHLTIDSNVWRSADWAKRKGLYAELHPDINAMDDSILRLSNSLSHNNPEAMGELKKVFWKGTEHWDQLLPERASISGRLVLSSYTKDFTKRFKQS